MRQSIFRCDILIEQRALSYGHVEGLGPYTSGNHNETCMYLLQIKADGCVKLKFALAEGKRPAHTGHTTWCCEAVLMPCMACRMLS